MLTNNLNSANGSQRSETLLSIIPCWLVFTMALLLPGSSSLAADDLLTAQERAWLKTHPDIRIAPDPDFPPIEYIDSNEEYRGIAADYVMLLEKKLGMKFQIAVLPSWDDVLAQAQSREIDMFGAAAATPLREQYMNFTAPHFELPGVIIVSTKVGQNLTLKDLHGLKVAVVSGYVWQELIERDHPEIELEPVPDLLSGLKRVSFGSVDAMVANLAIATHYIEKSGITNLRVAGETGYFGRYALAVRKDWPQLNAILEKGLAAITADERAAILQKWVTLGGKRSILENRTFWIIFLSLLALLTVVAILWWNWSLRRQVSRRTAALREEFSQRKRVEQAFDNSEQRYRTLFDSASDAVLILKDGKFVECNDAATNMFGDSRQQLIGQSPSRFSPPCQPDGHNSEEKADALITTCLDGTPQMFEWQHRRLDNTLFDAEVSLNAHIENDQQYILAIIRDITERKRIERLKDEFISTVSHEIRTPLTSIRGSLGLIKGGVTGDLPQKTSEILDIAYHNTERLLLLVNDLLDIQKLASGTIRLEQRTFDLAAFLDQAIIANQSYGDQYKIEYQLQAVATITITADYERLMQVMNNLLSNAAKFSPQGDVINISAEQHGSMVRVSVKDHGPGIPHQFRPQVFERFTQSDSSDTRQRGGTGLGLSIAKAIVELHGGTIGFHTMLGEGTEFYFELPVDA